MFDKQPDGDPHSECAEEISNLTKKISVMVAWLEANQPDVFRRGIWDALIPQYKFPVVTCSQCGGEFGPGDHGFSHCENHKHLPRLG